jgi:hypothetical protein
MPLPRLASNQKMPFLPRETVASKRRNSLRRRIPVEIHTPAQINSRTPCERLRWPARFKMDMSSSIRLALALALSFGLPPAGLLRAQETPVSEQDYEREELGVNRYTAPSIARIFQQLDGLKPLPFDQLKRAFQQTSHASRKQMGMIFGGLIADGFLLVACEKKDLVDDLGRVLLWQARSLGVAERVMRHSASLTELGKHGDWVAVRKELTATQADVEQAMIDLRDQKMAHLISPGGWLRGLEISAEAVEADFSPERARVLSQSDLVNYFSEQLKTLPPLLAHAPLFETIRTRMNVIRTLINKTPSAGLSAADVERIHEQAQKLNLAIQAAR